MNKDWINIRDKLCPEYGKGVKQFLEMAKNHVNRVGEVRCPCKKCMNGSWRKLQDVERHLLINGMLASYDHWVYHGEAVDFSGTLERQRRRSEGSSQVEVERINFDEEIEHNTANDMLDMLNDINRESIELEENVDESNFEINSSSTNEETEGSSDFEKLMEEACDEFYPGCTRVSSLHFLVKLMHFKVSNKWSDKSFDMLIKWLHFTLTPVKARVPSSFYEAKKKLRDLGLSYDSIHVCKHDCVLYRNEYKNLDHCPTCGESRYKLISAKGTKIPHKVLRHFPLVPRLKRMFSSTENAIDMRWHKEKRIDESGVLRHPADGEGWKHLDREFPRFASDARNVRLGLSSDGFNPYGHMSTTYSIWPVTLVPYNLPPWKCMKQTNLIMSLLIPGPKSPGKEIDVYLQPLIDELKELWNNGVRTYDASKKESFKLHAALLWTINDFPAYGDLSGWSTKGYQACPVCKEETSSTRLRGKIAYTGHRRYLPANHAWRKSKVFNGKTEAGEPPEPWSGEEILHQLNTMNFPVFSKHPSKQVKKRKQTENNWRKKSIFFDLPYWSKLLIRHKLDVMHIEKNVCENLLGTILNIEGKTKDTLNARLDLKDLKIRRDLHLKKEGDKFVKPYATYTLTSDERLEFLNFVKSVKFPDGFGSNISRCVSLNERKFIGLKTHDCHIMLQRLLPIGVRKFLPKEITTTIVELCAFFTDLCSKTLEVTELDRLQEDIIIILCKLEKIFPPAFFDVMVHLVLHLPYECKVVGPVHYSWMYPFERSMGTFKAHVRNEARPEGCIAEEYVMNEFLTFCSSYFSGMEPGLNRHDRNDDSTPNVEVFGEYDVYKQNVRPLGKASNLTLNAGDIRKIHWYILNNCEEISSFLTKHLDLIRPTIRTSADLYKKHEREFPDWFKKEVLEMRKNGNQCTDLYAMAMGPVSLYRSYTTCIVNGVRYRTLAHDAGHVTQNSGLMVNGEGDGSDGSKNYYGVLTEVIEVSFVSARKVMMFRCDWYNTDNKKGRYHIDLGIRTVNTSQYWFRDEPFILANQAKQVFYMDDPKHGKDWKVVQYVSNKSIWDVPEVDNSEADQVECITYGDGRNRVVESIEDSRLHRLDMVEPTTFNELEDEDEFINDDDDEENEFINDDDDET